jgi:hypothetical protein
MPVPRWELAGGNSKQILPSHPSTRQPVNSLSTIHHPLTTLNSQFSADMGVVNSSHELVNTRSISMGDK